MSSMSSDRRKAKKSERPLDRRRRFGAAEGRSVCDSGECGEILRHPEEALDGDEEVDVSGFGLFRGDGRHGRTQSGRRRRAGAGESVLGLSLVSPPRILAREKRTSNLFFSPPLRNGTNRRCVIGGGSLHFYGMVVIFRVKNRGACATHGCRV